MGALAGLVGGANGTLVGAGHAEADARCRPDSYREALLLLGVEAGSEPALIKRAYRKLISQHHPDKLAGAGASVERVRAATENP